MSPLVQTILGAGRAAGGVGSVVMMRFLLIDQSNLAYWAMFERLPGI